VTEVGVESDFAGGLIHSRRHSPDQGKEHVMIRLMLSALIFGTMAIALAGCRASGEVGSSSVITIPQ
jgi:hypothetical protein